MDEKPPFNSAAGAISNLHDMIKGQKEHEAKVMAFLKDYTATYVDLKARFTAAVAEIETLRADRDRLKADNDRLVRENRASEKEVNLLVNSIQVAGIEMQDSGIQLAEAARLASEGIADPGGAAAATEHALPDLEAVAAFQTPPESQPPAAAPDRDEEAIEIPPEFHGMPRGIAISLMNVDRMLKADAAPCGDPQPVAGALSALG